MRSDLKTDEQQSLDRAAPFQLLQRFAKGRLVTPASKAWDVGPPAWCSSRKRSAVVEAFVLSVSWL